MQIHFLFSHRWYQRMIKTKHGTCTIYIYCSLCISFIVFFNCKNACSRRTGLSTTPAGNRLFLYLIEATVADSFYCICWILNASEASRLSYRDEGAEGRKILFFIFSYCLCPVLDMFFSVFQVNREIHLALHREQKKKCFLEKSWEGLDEGVGAWNKVVWCWFLPPTYKKKGRRQNSFCFFPLLCLSKSRLSSGRAWSACLIAGWQWGSCRCWRRPRTGRWRRPGTGRRWTWTLRGRWWRWKGTGRRCGWGRSSRRWPGTGTRTPERGRRWWARGSWRRAT